MDREKVAAGLAVKSKDILPYLPLSSIATDEKNKNNRNSRLSGMEYGYSFLEKFIQIPFQVPQPTNYDFQILKKKLLLFNKKKFSFLPK
ncbi:MAG: hypothetical protein KME49_33035 [Brasilonema octagenarum HA4186-MV1]|jgi:hypothetical protein|nr:hypothetical protein [Brasilonema octagenarum HA4186-MV1]